jgi:lipoprotein NlpI/transglutaminase-like putative cysteine protease
LAALLGSLSGAVPAAVPARRAHTAAVAAQAARPGPRGYAIGPAPTWVVPAKERVSPPVDRSPMHYRIVDEQTRLDGSGEQDYLHVIREVNDSAGLAAAAHIEIVLDPDYQKLTLHRLDVVRDGHRHSHLDQGFPLLRREPQLEKQVYDGRLTLSIVLDDVRAGDEIDYAFTLSGANPVFGGKFVHLAAMANGLAPEALHQVRLLAPAGREIHYTSGIKDLQVTSHDANGMHELIARRESIPQLQFEPQMIPAAMLPEFLQFSEFAGWADVTGWGTRLFSAMAPAPQVDALIASMKSAQAKPAERVLAALDFVQQQIRYFGTEFGANSHQPAAPEKVLQQRFGDCKDKTALLLALLKGIDVPAVPVLVSANLRAAASQQLPSPLAFDHVVVRATIDGRTYWLDGTRNYQTGPLEERTISWFGQGLALAAQGGGLVDTPVESDVEKLSVVDRIHIDAFAADPTLESRVTLHEDAAEAIRAALATQGEKAVADQFSAPYLKIYPKAKLKAPLKVEQSATADSVTLVQTFTLGDFWQLMGDSTLETNLTPYFIADALNVPPAETRRYPMQVPIVGVIRQSIYLEMPEDTFRETTSKQQDYDDKYFHLHQSMGSVPRGLNYEGELRLPLSQVEPADWKEFTSRLNDTRRHLSLVAHAPALSFAQQAAMLQQMKTLVETGKRRHEATTADEFRAQVRLVKLSALISSGRLPAKLEAQARADRGELEDNAGHYEAGRADFERATELDPESARYWNDAAINALAYQQFDRVIERTGKALTLDGANVQAMLTRGRARYLAGDLTAAQADFEAALRNASTVREGYGLIWLALVKLHDAPADAPVLAGYPDGNWPKEWPRPILDYLVGRKSATELLASARLGNKSLEQLCESYFYLGEAAFQRGQAKDAQENWQKTVSQQVIGFVEDTSARYRLKMAPSR